jgi:predicted PhzF superfamily epimerase YddE/YHI9
MTAIAADVGCPDTAFLFRTDAAFYIRWWNAAGELSLCAHATLAAAAVVLRHFDTGRSAVTFESGSGPLHVARRDDLFVADFPRLHATPTEAPEALLSGLGATPREVLRAGKYVVVYDDEEEIRRLTPNLSKLATLQTEGVIVTARAQNCDFVVRSFAIGDGRAREEHVSASAQTRLVPYWSAALGKTHLVARQLSPRGAELFCDDDGTRVHVGGRAVDAVNGTLFV